MLTALVDCGDEGFAAVGGNIASDLTLKGTAVTGQAISGAPFTANYQSGIGRGSWSLYWSQIKNRCQSGR